MIGPGGTSAISSADKFTYLGVTGVSSTLATGIYGEAAVVPILVTFSEPVNVTGTPQLALNPGSGATASYASGSGTSTLIFNYTVAAGQSTYDLDYGSITALNLNGGTISDATNNAATLTLPATGSDGLATQNIVIAPVSDGFETGDFSELSWQLSSSGASPANWTVQSSVVHSGTYAAQSGAIGASSTSTLSVTLPATEPAGEFAFWRKVSSAAGSSLTFEIDGVSVGQWSGTVPWQQSFYWVPAAGGTSHTFTWIYNQGSTMAGSNAAWLDDVQFLPGTTLAVEGTAAAGDQFTFNASSSSIVVGLNGESHTFAATNFTKYLFLGNGSGASATLTGSASGNSALLYANGTGQLNNSTAGYAVSVDGMASMHANGHVGDTVKFFDSPGNDTYYAYADYGTTDEPSSGMYGSGFSNSATGFGTNIGYSTNGGSDTADLLRFDEHRHLLRLHRLRHDRQAFVRDVWQFRRLRAYSDSANGFATNIGNSTISAAPIAIRPISSIRRTPPPTMPTRERHRPACTAAMAAQSCQLGQWLRHERWLCDEQPQRHGLFHRFDEHRHLLCLFEPASSGMYGSYSGASYANSAEGFATNVGLATKSLKDTAYLYASATTATYYAYTNQTVLRRRACTAAAMPNSVSGFGTNLGYAQSGGGTAYLYDTQGRANVLRRRLHPELQRQARRRHGRQRDYQFGLWLRHQRRLYDRLHRHGLFLRFAGKRHLLCLSGLQRHREFAGMYGSYYNGGYSNSATGFSTNIGYSTAGGTDTRLPYDSPGNDTFYAYADYGTTGKPSAGIYGTYTTGSGNVTYSSSAIDFATDLGYPRAAARTRPIYQSAVSNRSIRMRQLPNSTVELRAGGIRLRRVIATGGTGMGCDQTDTKGPNALTYQLSLIGKLGCLILQGYPESWFGHLGHGSPHAQARNGFWAIFHVHSSLARWASLSQSPPQTFRIACKLGRLQLAEFLRHVETVGLGFQRVAGHAEGPRTAAAADRVVLADAALALETAGLAEAEKTGASDRPRPRCLRETGRNGSAGSRPAGSRPCC